MWKESTQPQVNAIYHPVVRDQILAKVERLYGDDYHAQEWITTPRGVNGYREFGDLDLAPDILVT